MCVYICVFVCIYMCISLCACVYMCLAYVNYMVGQGHICIACAQAGAILQIGVVVKAVRVRVT
jgi:hypothetical protein